MKSWMKFSFLAILCVPVSPAEKVYSRGNKYIILDPEQVVGSNDLLRISEGKIETVPSLIGKKPEDENTIKILKKCKCVLKVSNRMKKSPLSKGLIASQSPIQGGIWGEDRIIEVILSEGP
ncbi:MAG: hypothetical protein EOO46_23120 [Flavobacterium sp.]|nr:MAG: hypothetical protein EOO46_23120 [Flavobacterium sp.]